MMSLSTFEADFLKCELLTVGICIIHVLSNASYAERAQ